MFNYFLKLILFVYSTIFFHFSQAGIASVNNKDISEELLVFIKSEIKKQGRSINSDMEENIVDRLIDLEVINQAAKESGLLADPMIMAQAELSTKELIYKLYLQKYILDNPISNDAIDREYDQFKLNYSAKEYNASHILVKSRNKAKKIIKQLTKGALFEELVSKYTIDEETKEHKGDLGWFTEDLMVKTFYDAVVNLDKGKFTKKPIQTQFGWHIIRLNNTRKLEVPLLSEKKDEIKTKLQKEKLKLHLKKLRSYAQINITN